MKKKTISELYQECKQKQEIKQQLMETTELFKKQLTEDLFCAPVRFSPPPVPPVPPVPPIPPIPQSFRGKV